MDSTLQFFYHFSRLQLVVLLISTALYQEIQLYNFGGENLGLKQSTDTRHSLQAYANAYTVYPEPYISVLQRQAEEPMHSVILYNLINSMFSSIYNSSSCHLGQSLLILLSRCIRFKCLTLKCAQLSSGEACTWTQTTTV